jgi:iron complex outermembrane receptor protein
MSARFRRGLLLSFSILGCAAMATPTMAQVALPQITVTAPSPIQRFPGGTNGGNGLQGTLPIVTGQFATVTVVPNAEIRRSGAATLGDLLLNKPGITGSSFAPGASSRPIIRGLDVNRVRIQENGIGANGASDLGEDHFVPVDPLITDRVEVIRGPATLRFGSQAIGGVIETSNNRIPTAIPPRGVGAEVRGGFSSVDRGVDGAVLLDAGAGNVAVHADAFGRNAQDYRVPNYPYLTAPDPADLPNATQAGAFNGRQPNSATRNNGQAAGGSYIFSDGFLGFAATQNNALYRIPGAEGESNQTRIDADRPKF